VSSLPGSLSTRACCSGCTGSDLPVAGGAGSHLRGSGRTDPDLSIARRTQESLRYARRTTARVPDACSVCANLRDACRSAAPLSNTRPAGQGLHEVRFCPALPPRQEVPVINWEPVYRWHEGIRQFFMRRARNRLRQDLLTGIEELDRGEVIDADDVFRELDEKASHLARTDR